MDYMDDVSLQPIFKSKLRNDVLEVLVSIQI